jgi:hypothetical protein
MPVATRSRDSRPDGHRSLLVADVRTGETVYSLDPDRLAFTEAREQLDLGHLRLLRGRVSGEAREAERSPTSDQLSRVW